MLVSHELSCLYFSTHSLLLSALCRLNADVDTSVVDFTSCDLSVKLELQALLGKEFLRLLRNVVIHTRATDLTQEFNNGDLGAETRPHGCLPKLEQ